MTKTTVHSVRLFDGESVHDNATVSFDSSTGLITSISTAAAATTATGNVNTIDGTGYTLIPGLIEAHMHAHDDHLFEHGYTVDTAPTELKGILASAVKMGVTTVCDMHSDLEAITTVRGWLADEKKRGTGDSILPDLKTSMLGATIEGGWPKPIVLGRTPSQETLAKVSKWPNLTPDAAEEFVVSHKKAGADYIKLMQEDGCSFAFPGHIPAATLELQTAVVDAAHKHGLLAVGHAVSLDNTKLLLKAGVDGLTHTFVDQPVDEEVVKLYKKTGAFVIPTLVVHASLTGEEQETRERFAEVAVSKGLMGEAVRKMKTTAMGMKAEKVRLEYAFDNIRKLKSEGIDVVAGTDSVAGLVGTAIGLSLWMELELYVEKCGMNVLDALRAATGVCARRFGFLDRGMVMEGKRADLVLVKGDLTKDLGAWQNITGVWKAGVKSA